MGVVPVQRRGAKGNRWRTAGRFLTSIAVHKIAVLPRHTLHLKSVRWMRKVCGYVSGWRGGWAA